MLDAVRMCGRWMSKTILGRITQRTMEPPTRKEVVESFAAVPIGAMATRRCYGAEDADGEGWKGGV